MNRVGVAVIWICLLVGLFGAAPSRAEVNLIAIGTLDSSRAGAWTDLSGLRYNLENGQPAAMLGGLGSGLAYASGNTFIALPDRGTTAIPFDDLIDSSVSYVSRFHTVSMSLKPNKTGTGLPFTLNINLLKTTLLWSLPRLVYGTGEGLDVGPGTPPINNFLQHFFSGRSDNYNPKFNSGYPYDGRLDPEAVRLSNDGRSVFISDEYGPYVYQFDRLTGLRIRSFQVPSTFFINTLSPMASVEIADNIAGRTANLGMEGLAITPDGKTLVGMMQGPLIQDFNEGGVATKLLRIVTIDIASGRTTHQFAYLLTTGTVVSEICALNENEFLVDERDGTGRGDETDAAVKQIFKIDLAGSVDVSEMDGLTAASNAVGKILFLDIVKELTADGISAAEIPSKIEGVAIGPDLKADGATLHTLWVSNDNSFLKTVADPDGNQIANPNQFFVFGFDDSDLDGSQLVPQQFKSSLPVN